jgi:Spy/CpxP family protein refolding chaperone
MNDSTKLWKWMVALLAILNITLLIALFNGRKHIEQMHHEVMMNSHGKPSDLLVEELKLNPDQVKQFETLKDEHKAAIRQLMKEGHELRNDFFDLLKTDSVNQKMVSEKAMAIASNQQGIEMATFNHFQKVRQLCNTDQKKHFDEIINDVLRQMAGPPGRPPHDGPPPPHHP